MKVLITGAAGFIGGYLVDEFLCNGWEVVGLDNFSKYGEGAKQVINHPNYRLVRGDAQNPFTIRDLLGGCDHFVAAAAMVGGVGYFHDYAYDLMAVNQRITAASFDAAISAHRAGRLQKITIISSSMVYGATAKYPTPEGAQLSSPPPRNVYGVQKLALEMFALAAQAQYHLPFTIVRPFNCVGIGDLPAKLDLEKGATLQRQTRSHVLPDLVFKVLQGQDPLRILGSGTQVRHYTHGRDIARGIRLAVESPLAINEDFNIAFDRPTTVIELAEEIWKRVRLGVPFRHISETPYPDDVERREPDTSKARELLGFEAQISLSQVLDEVIPWAKEQLNAGVL